MDVLHILDSLDLPNEVKEKLRAMQPAPTPHLPTIVKRLSLLRSFTERLFAVATTGLDQPPRFTDFVATEAVEGLSGHPERFSINENRRAEHVADWAKNRAECATVARDFLAVLDPGHPIESYDVMQLLFVSGAQGVARAKLREAFEQADTANDIAQCAALVQLVTPTIRLFGSPQCAALLNELRSRSQSRNLFFPEFYQTARYFPQAIEKDLREFAVATTGPWIFHLHATGGMGKTTLLRRLISHDWILGQKHIPCAWLDFDYLDVTTVLEQPLLLALPMAAQWNEQLEHPLFGAFLTTSFQPLASLLFRTRGDASATGLDAQTLDQRSRNQYRAGLSNPMRCGMLAGAVPPRTLEERTQRLLQTRSILPSFWEDKLPEAIASMPTDRPVLLFMDTLEDASLQNGQQLLATLELLRKLRHAAHARADAMGRPRVNLRLVLSGRHELGKEHVPEFADQFKDEYVQVAMLGLQATHAHAFLDQEIAPNKHARHRQQLIDAMVGKSLGIPFNLSLFAEWANEDDELDPATVTASADVSTVMLIERIVKRIEYQPLRWIIRYGAVPRRLSQEFLRDVMREPLLDALSGRSAAAGIDRADSKAERDVWTRDPNFVFDAKVLWEKYVVPYTGARSWLAPGEVASEVAFRSDILQPMRRLLRKQPIFAQLHQRSQQWFASQAQEGEWSPAHIECLYHASQLRLVPGATIESYLPALQRLIDTPTLSRDAALRAAVCQELRQPDFDELLPAEKAYVEYRLAEAIAAQHDYSYADPEARRHLLAAFEIGGELAAATLPPFAEVWKRAAHGGLPMSDLIKALHDLGESDDALRVALMLAQMTGTSRIARDVLGHAIDDKWAKPVAGLGSLPQFSTGSVPVAIVAERLAKALRADQPDRAVHYFEVAANDFRARGDGVRFSEASRLAAATALSIGQLARAEKLLGTSASEMNAGFLIELARVDLAKGNPGQALQRLRAVGSPRDSNEIEALILRAEGHSQRMLLNEAKDAWEEAFRSATQRADTGALSRIVTGQARFYYWWLRTTAQATPGSVQAQLQRIQYVQASAQSSAAAADQRPPADVEIWQMVVPGATDATRWQRRAGGELGGESPTARIRLTFALSQVAPLPPRRWTELIEQAELLPRSARWVALVEPVLHGQPPELPVTTRQSIADAFRHEPEGEIESAWYAVRYGELLAWLDFAEAAVELLRRHVAVLNSRFFGEAWRAAVYRQRRRVEQRIRRRMLERGDGKPGAFPPPEPDPADLWSQFWRHTPFRAAAALVENAQRACDADLPDLMHACLDHADPALKELPLETEFHLQANQLRDRAADRSRPKTRSARPATGPPPTSTPLVESGSPLVDHGLRLNGPPFEVVDMREQSGRLAVSVERTPGDRVISADSKTLEIILRARGLPRRLAGLPLEEIQRDLEEWLDASGVPRSGRVALKMHCSPLSSTPWELAFRDSMPPFRLPSVWDEKAEAAISIGHPSDARSPRSGTVFLMPSSPLDKESPVFRSYVALSSLFDRERVFFDVKELANRFDAAQAIYIASSFIEIPSLNEPALAASEWTATSLAHAIAVKSDQRKPAVILDVPAPAMPTNWIHQLVLRNFFAHALIDSGAVSYVFATGLYPDGLLNELHGLIFHGLSTEAPRIQLLDSVAAYARSNQGVAHDVLFTGHPYLPLAAGPLGYA